MNCPNCKNPIQKNKNECEWCGVVINNSDRTAPNSQSISNDSLADVPIPLKVETKNKIKYFLPGLVILLIWILGNLISERDKHAIFNMDDLSPILILGLILFGIGFITKLIKN